MKQAYSVFTITKATDDRDERVISGVASTPEVDRMGDVVEPSGVQMKLPLPLLYQHDRERPLGHVTEARVTQAGIEITAKIVKGVLPYIDDAWALIKAGVVRGLSIGFSPIESMRLDGGGRRFTRWELLELSAVTIAANASASIQTIKAADQVLLRQSARPPRFLDGRECAREMQKASEGLGTSSDPEQVFATLLVALAKHLATRSRAAHLVVSSRIDQLSERMAELERRDGS